MELRAGEGMSVRIIYDEASPIRFFVVGARFSVPAHAGASQATSFLVEADLQVGG